MPASKSAPCSTQVADRAHDGPVATADPSHQWIHLTSFSETKVRKSSACVRNASWSAPVIAQSPVSTASSGTDRPTAPEYPLPEAALAVRDKLGNADAVWVVVSEYKKEIPDSLRNLFDWLSLPSTKDEEGKNVLDQKPVAI